MAIQLQLRRGSDVENDEFIGAPGEVTVDLNRRTLRVHDGETPGGQETARSDLINTRVGATLTPTISSEFDLGSSNLRYRNLFLSNSIILGETIIQSSGEGLTITSEGSVITLDDTAKSLRTARNISSFGDVEYSISFDGSQDVSGEAILKTVNENTGIFGSSIRVPSFNVNEKGLILSVEEIDIDFPELPEIVEDGTFGSSLEIPIVTVNKQGLITSITTVDSGLRDIFDEPVTYGSNIQVPVFTVNEKGLIVSIENQDISFPDTFELPDIFDEPVTYGSSTQIPIFTINEKGLVVSAETQEIVFPDTPNLPSLISNPGTYGDGTKVPIVSVNEQGLVTGIDSVDIIAATNLPDITIPGTYGDGTKVPIVSVNAQGLVTGIESVDILASTNLPNITIPGTYGDSDNIPIITVNEKGLITSTETAKINSPIKLVANISDRDAITLERREEGMLVVTQDTNLVWQWNSEEGWKPFPAANNRKVLFHNLGIIEAFDQVDFELEMSQAVVVYYLSVSAPCHFEVFESPLRDDTNPFKFIATENHLIDDGSTILSDGNVLRGRRYHIWVNRTDVLNNVIYFRVSNYSEEPIDLSFIVQYLPLELSIV